jgi:hypothetical protein
MWDWGSPIAWAVFLLGAGGCAVLLGLGFQFMASAVHKLASVPVSKRNK